jgi:tetratricopeptide (TPR) repeat protein
MAPFPANVRPRWSAVLLIAVAVAAPARAQDEVEDAPVQTISDEPELSPKESDRKARALFKQGAEAYEDGRYRDAWDYFRQAYLLSKRPELLYNVGQAADRLRMDREALEAFKLYLARLPEAENRREVENRVRALEERLGAGASASSGSSTEEADPAYVTAEGQNEAAIFDAAPGAEQDQEQDEAEDAAKDDASDARTGWYVRLALGLGVLSDNVTGLSQDATVSSATGMGHAALGHDLTKGVVLGGALMFEWGLSASVQLGDFQADVDTANLTLFAVFLDYYFAPDNDGWHALGGLALAWLSLSERGGVLGVEDASGGGLVLGGGYDWPAFDEEWTVGVLGRFIVAKVDQDVGKHVLGTLSVAATLTWY